MTTKKVLGVGFVCLMAFIGISTYLWYLYFHSLEDDILVKTVRLELLNNGNIKYVNAVPEDTSDDVPTYYFRMKNNVDKSLKYKLLIHDVSASKVNDGCSDSNNFKRNELEYELKQDSKVVKRGKLSELSRDVLYSDKIDAGHTENYALKIWISSDTMQSKDRHYHYEIGFEEIE